MLFGGNAKKQNAHIARSKIELSIFEYLGVFHRYFQKCWNMRSCEIQLLLLSCREFSHPFRAYPGSEFIVANTFAKWKKVGAK